MTAQRTLPQPPPVDVREALAAELRAAIHGEVRFDDGSRALYATDASNYRQVPIGVVLPRDTEDIEAVLAVCRRYRAPVLARGGGTSLAGQCCNVAVVMDMTKYAHRLLEIDPERRSARVEPGIILDSLRAAAEQYHLTFAPDPATHTHNTLGGMIGNNSCGVHSVMGGRTSENIESLDVITYDGVRMHVGATSDEEYEAIVSSGGRRGEIYGALRALRDRYGDMIRQRFPKIPRRVSGYALDELLPEQGFNVARALVGSEGTCATVLEATVRLVPSPPVRSLLVLGWPDIFQAADHVPEIVEHGVIALEGIDDRLVEAMRRKHLHPQDVQLLPPGGGWLLAEFGGDSKAESDGKARQLMETLRGGANPPSMKLVDDPNEERVIWKVRESGLGATARVPGEPDTWEGWEDAAVAPEHLGAYLREFRALLDRHGYLCALYGHFGQGCVHTRIDFDLKSAPGVAKFRAFIDDAADLVVQHGGSLSGEHGDGQSRASLLPKMYGPELVQAFEEFKRIWDPDGRMNPGKIVEPFTPTQNLRYGADYHPFDPPTHFAFPDDRGSFAYAMERCVGVGECRRLDGGVMCPSYMATREERHSTRGRARVLFEMLRGEELHGGWREPAVREALDLCLSCKGCKSDCPMNVDMASYKAEFYSHYYARRLRPRAAYSMGLIHWWARLAAIEPGLVNLAGRAPLLGRLTKALGGIAPQRRLPAFAGETLRHWFEARPPADDQRPRVLLWPDTFTNAFEPGIGRAAVEVLERAGYRVELPQRDACCGRPLYDWGMLDMAKRWWENVLDVLGPALEAGTPVIALEPSCASAFRDELPNLFPDDERASRLRDQTFLFSEFLVDKADWRPPVLPRKALVQFHCHHHAVLGTDAESELMRRMGLRVEVPDSGCCGMAGAFGFEAGEHYDVSIAAGERALLPAVRAADRETLVIADGFSCRQQIAQTTPRRALHLAEVVQLALHGTPTDGALPEAALKETVPLRPRLRTVAAGVAIGAGAIAAAGRALRRH